MLSKICNEKYVVIIKCLFTCTRDITAKLFSNHYDYLSIFRQFCLKVRQTEIAITAGPAARPSNFEDLYKKCLIVYNDCFPVKCLWEVEGDWKKKGKKLNLQMNELKLFSV